MKNVSRERTHWLGSIGLGMIAISLAALLPPAVSFAQTLNTITLISGISPEALIGSQDPANLVSATSQPAYIVAPHPAYSIIPGTQYINWSPDINSGPFNTSTSYRTSFTLPVGFCNPSLTVQIFADNVATVFLNGNQVGQQPFAEILPNFQNPPTTFTVINPSLFHAGQNILSFDIHNFGGPTAFDYKAIVSFCIPFNCPLTQGFWKNHPDAWPVNSLTLGNVGYTKAQLLIIFNTPVGGRGGSDASLILAHQLIAAKLNIANGSNPAPIAGTIASADALIGGSTIPMNIRTNTPLGQQMAALASTLDSYNNGALTPEDCEASAATIQEGSKTEEAGIEIVPTRFALEQNYPNPFNPTTSIRYGLPEQSFVNLQIYDVLGREVAELVNEVQPAGYHVVDFDARSLSSGIYFYSIRSASVGDRSKNFAQVRKMLLLK